MSRHSGRRSMAMFGRGIPSRRRTFVPEMSRCKIKADRDGAAAFLHLNGIALRPFLLRVVIRPEQPSAPGRPQSIAFSFAAHRKNTSWDIIPLVLSGPIPLVSD